MAEVVVVATIPAKPGHLDALVAVFAENAAAVHAEDGCLLYAAHTGEDQLVMVERWASPEALATHSTGAALQNVGRQIAEHVAGAPVVLRLTAVPAGDPTKGALA